jgi:mRNA interferase HicA
LGPGPAAACVANATDFSRSVERRARIRRPHPWNRSGRGDEQRNTYVVVLPRVTSQEFKRWLQKQGCRFEPGHGGHLIVRLGDRMSVLPMHGKQLELKTGTVNGIKKDLGLK